MKLRLISLTPLPLSPSYALYLVSSFSRSPLLAAMTEFLSGRVTRGLSIAEESSTLQPFPFLDAAPQQHSVREIRLNDEKRT